MNAQLLFIDLEELVYLVFSTLLTLIEEISSTKLVPGDLVEITDELSIPCDLVLISGESVINESMLTGTF